MNVWKYITYLGVIAVCIYLILTILRSYEFRSKMNLAQAFNYQYQIIKDSILLALILVLCEYCVQKFLGL